MTKKPARTAGFTFHLGGDINRAFFLAGRNSTPENTSYGANNPAGARPGNPYNSANTVRANRYSGSGQFKVSFQEKITTEPGKTPPKANPVILHRGSAYTLLPCDNNLTALGVSEEAIAGAARPEAVQAAIESGLGEIASLMKPVFYQDNRHTLFVEPQVTEQTIEEWQEWVTRTPQPDTGKRPDWWKDIIVIPEKKRKGPILEPWPRADIEIDRGALVDPVSKRDWLVNPATVLQFDDVLIGPTGQPGLKIQTGPGAETMAETGTQVNINPGSSLASLGTVVLADAAVLEQSGLIQAAGGLNVVDSTGFNSALEKNFNELNRANFGTGKFGAGKTRA